MNILVVGCGSIGSRHIRNLLKAEIPGLKLSVFDKDVRRLETVGRSLGVLTVSQWGEALNTKPFLSFVCVPTHLHVPLAMELANEGSHLFIEKPLAGALDGVKSLIDVVEKKGLIALVGCNMRFHKGVSRLREEVMRGAIGDIYSIQAHYGHYLPNWRPTTDYRGTYSTLAEKGGGIIFDGIHEINYVRWFGGEVKKVYCMAQQVSDLEIGAEDNADIFLLLENKIQSVIHLDYLDRVKRRSCQIVGSLGTLIWSSLRKDPEEVLFEHHRSNEIVSRESFYLDPNTPYVEELRHLLGCLEGWSQPLVGLREGLADLKVALASHTSASSGRLIDMKTIG
jgi:predicted dehydrogenase